MERYVLFLKACCASDQQIGFPETIDKVDPEIGQFAGPKPVLFRKFNSINAGHYYDH